MRPTISEQLAGIRRVLADVVAPEVTGAYAVDTLRGVLANLEMLERSWARVAPFLVWDNTATAGVLRQVAPHVEPRLSVRIYDTLAADEPDPADVDALDARSTALRELLAEVVPAVAGGGDAASDAYRVLCAHLRERIGRFPLSMNAPMPGAVR